MVNDDPIRPYFSPSVQEMGLDRLAPVVHRPPVRESYQFDDHGYMFI